MRGESCRVMPEVRDKRADFYRRRSKYVGMSVSEARRLKLLEEENRRLKQIVGEQALDIRALKAALEKSTKSYSAEGSRFSNEVRGAERAAIMQVGGTGQGNIQIQTQG